MDTSEMYARGLRRRKKMFGEAEVERRMAASGEFGAPLQNIINAYVYGDVWERDGLADDIRSLVMLGITAASNRPNNPEPPIRVPFSYVTRRGGGLLFCIARLPAAVRRIPASGRQSSVLRLNVNR